MRHHHMHGRGDRHARWEARLEQVALHAMRGGRGGPIGGDWFASGERPGGGRRARMFDGSELRLVLLKLIADEPRHGYDLIRAIEALTAGAYAPSPGVVYPTLTLLDEMGLIEEQQSEGAKKRFGATAAGQAHLAEHAAQVEAIMARLEALAAHRERADIAPIRRAMGNLRVALGNAFAQGEVPQERLHEVAAMIDELAQKVERLK
jgi:DNA-binding PadR family transcriptional regulator